MTVAAALEGVDVELAGKTVLDNVSLTVEPGRFLTLLGPSGSGKSTTLNVFAGFIRPSKGRVTFNGRAVESLPVHLRDIGFVFQNYALFPHMTVEQNVAFSLRTRHMKKNIVRTRVRDALELVRMSELATRSVRSLSGGQQQRVALARALVYEPSLLLLDEPLAALDKQLREGMQVEIKRIQREIGVTAIAVTHDQTEALTMSDHVAIISGGRIEQVGAPREVYDRPASVFVAQFLGEANLVAVDRHGHLAGIDIKLSNQSPGTAVIRPENVRICAADERGHGRVEVVVEEAIFQGNRVRVSVRGLHVPTLRLVVSVPADTSPSAIQVGKLVTAVVDASAIHVIPAA